MVAFQGDELHMGIVFYEGMDVEASAVHLDA